LFIDGLYTIDYYFATKDTFRVAPGNEIAVLIPFDSYKSTPAVEDIASSVRSDIKQILTEGGINISSYTVRRLVASRYPSVRNGGPRLFLFNIHSRNYSRFYLRVLLIHIHSTLESCF
jgi:hypothetical protein